MFQKYKSRFALFLSFSLMLSTYSASAYDFSNFYRPQEPSLSMDDKIIIGEIFLCASLAIWGIYTMATEPYRSPTESNPSWIKEKTQSRARLYTDEDYQTFCALIELLKSITHSSISKKEITYKFEEEIRYYERFFGATLGKKFSPDQLYEKHTDLDLNLFYGQNLIGTFPNFKNKNFSDKMGCVAGHFTQRGIVIELANDKSLNLHTPWGEIGIPGDPFINLEHIQKKFEIVPYQGWFYSDQNRYIVKQVKNTTLPINGTKSCVFVVPHHYFIHNPRAYFVDSTFKKEQITREKYLARRQRAFLRMLDRYNQEHSETSNE